NELNIISDIDLDNYDNLIENGEKISFKLNEDSLFYDFSDKESKNNEIIIKKLRKLMPICGIIDLVNEAIKLGVITDISQDFKAMPLTEYENDYSKITKAFAFYYKINSELFDDTVYKITFDKKNHDIKKKIEYASRTSLFIDTLMKRIMTKYNILLVRKASWNELDAPKLRLDKNTICDSYEISDSTLETDMIENQLKVLINYRDNFNNTTCTENVIDDIFLNVDGNNINYGFFKIGKSNDNDPIYEVINEDVSADDIDSLLKIRNLINEPEVKFNIFETLRNNNETNLSNLIDLRIKEYEQRLNTDPKIEFTITPLSIYCNHIVKKTATFTLKSNNRFFKDFEYDYSVEYNPANIDECEYNIYGDGDIDRLRDDEELILAFSDLYDNKDLHMKVTSKRFATCLYDLNNHYHSDKYKDVYFLNDNLVKLKDNSILPYDGNPDEFTYLRSQIVMGEISGNYIYIKDATKVDDKDILGVDLLDIDTDRYVANEYVRKCDICGHVFGATSEVWEEYKKAHVLVNDINTRSCCDNCVGTILDTGNAVIYSKGYNEYYLDNPKDLKYTDICLACENPMDAFIHINNSNNLTKMCKICHKHYCQEHLDIKTHVCINCSQKTSKRSSISNDKFIKLIKSNLEPKDILSKDLEFNYDKDDLSLWVYSKRKNKKVTYYFITDENEKFVHLFGKYTKRGEK
ncbi:MAG: hypothetical protein K6E20_04785, partial [Acholeplasmatales bacterium]|nr:hypothetical protein [Acholeplasmatales bacterium]